MLEANSSCHCSKGERGDGKYGSARGTSSSGSKSDQRYYACYKRQSAGYHPEPAGRAGFCGTEPERRDTFPAIALAASYLKLKKKCEDDEVVVIMPCDPYTELEYFHTIARMVECVEKTSPTSC